MDGFGHRSDPFSGEGAMHTGVDISAPWAHPLRLTADGVVIFANWNGGYGRCVIVDHGNGYQTLVRASFRIDVIEGQEIRQGEIVWARRQYGPLHRAASALRSPRSHTPVNPYRFVAQTSAMKSAPAVNEFPF